MSQGKFYATKFGNLSTADANLLSSYSDFQAGLRIEETYQAPTAEEYLKRKSFGKEIKISTENELINELLRYHGWASKFQTPMGGDGKARSVSFVDILLSFDTLYAFCQWRLNERSVKPKSLLKICHSVIVMLEFMRSSNKVDEDDLHKVSQVLVHTRSLLSDYKKSADEELSRRPSLDGLREDGKALSFLDIVKVCQYQQSRVDTLQSLLGNCDNHSSNQKKFLRKQLNLEISRVVIISTLIRYPLRTGEIKTCYIAKDGSGFWRLRLLDNSRKAKGFPINTLLSDAEVRMFELFSSAQKIEREVDDKSWEPFKGLHLTEILKGITLDVAGVAVTVSKLRVAAETHCSVIEGKEQYDLRKIQESLTYVEGHSAKIAKDHYKLNEATTMPNAWRDYVKSLLDPQEKSFSGEDLRRKKIDGVIHQKMSKLHMDWEKSLKRELKQKGREGRGAAEDMNERKKRIKWSEEEEAELMDQFDYYGKGEWKQILKNSTILQKRYKSSPSENHASESLRNRYNNIVRGCSNKSTSVKFNNCTIQSYKAGKVPIAMNASDHSGSLTNVDSKHPRLRKAGFLNTRRRRRKNKPVNRVGANLDVFEFCDD